MGRDTIDELKVIANEIKLDSLNQVIKYLIEIYKAVREEVKGQRLSCPYCRVIGFQSTIQLRKHIAKKHFYDIHLDWKKWSKD